MFFVFVKYFSELRYILYTVLTFYVCKYMKILYTYNKVKQFFLISSAFYSKKSENYIKNNGQRMQRTDN